jgi:hypothetical protein
VSYPLASFSDERSTLLLASPYRLPNSAAVVPATYSATRRSIVPASSRLLTRRSRLRWARRFGRAGSVPLTKVSTAGFNLNPLRPTVKGLRCLTRVAEPGQWLRPTTGPAEQPQRGAGGRRRIRQLRLASAIYLIKGDRNIVEVPAE